MPIPNTTLYRRQIKWYDPALNTYLCQGVSTGLSFTFLSEKDEQVSQFFNCKDYLQDAIFTHLHDKPITIYGFSSKKIFKVPLKSTRLLISNASDKTLRDKIPNVKELLHQLEDALSIPHSVIKEAYNPPKQYVAGGIWFIEGDVRWIASPVMISLYSLIIRVGFSHVLGTPLMKSLSDMATGNTPTYQPIDYSRLSSSLEGIKRIIEKGDQKIFGDDMKANYPKNVDVTITHNYLGIVAFTSGYCSRYVPQWQKNCE